MQGKRLTFIFLILLTLSITTVFAQNCSLRCHYDNAFANLTLFINKGSAFSEDKNMVVVSADDWKLIESSTLEFELVINQSWSKITDADLGRNPNSGMLITSLIAVTQNYVMLQEYENASRTLVILDQIMSLHGDPWWHDQFQSTVAKLHAENDLNVNISYSWDFDPVDFSKHQMRPLIILKSKNQYLNAIKISYLSEDGIHVKNISKINGEFKFNEKIILEHKAAEWFPFDYYHAALIVFPNFVNSTVKQFELSSEEPDLVATASFTSDRINMNFARPNQNIFRTLLDFIVFCTAAAYLVFKGIKLIQEKTKLSKEISWENGFNVLLFITLVATFALFPKSANILAIISYIVLFILCLVALIVAIKLTRKKKKK